MAKHAVKSPSASDRWMTCLGSLALSEGMPNPSSKYADEGTAGHFLGSHCLLQQKDACEFIGHKIELRETPDGEHYEEWHGKPSTTGDWKLLNTFVVSDEMVEAVQVYLDYVRDVVKSTGGILFVEVQVPIWHLTDEEDATGTSDAIVLTDDEIIVIDLKYGRGVEVSAIENRQMRIYGSGAIKHVEDLVGGTESIKRVRMAISQPRVSTLPSEWTCTIEELRAFENEVRIAAVAAERMRTGEIPMELVVSDKGCRFCRAKAKCPKVIEVIEEAIGTDDFTNLNAVPAVTNTEDNDLLGRHLSIVDFVEGWCKAVRAEGESQLLAGSIVPGWKLVQGRKGNRSWIDEAKAAAVLKKLKLKKEEMYEFKLISPTTAEKVVGKESENWSKVQEVITQKEGGLSVAPESDNRKAVEVQPVTEGFFPLTE